MSHVNTVKAVMAAFEAKDYQLAGSYLSDEMLFSGPVPQPLNKHAFIGFLQSCIAALPDWSFNLHNVHEHNSESVDAVIQITGTHSQTLAIPGLPSVSATGKHVFLPAEPMHFTFKQDKIVSIVVDSVPAGGVPGLYAQIGSPLSAH